MLTATIRWSNGKKRARLALGRLRDKLFKGSGELLMTQLVADEPLSPAAVRRLRKQLDERLKREEER